MLITVNKTITVPLGTSDHGDPRLLCVPTKWTDIAIFFLGNYVAHAATVRPLPGEPVIPAFVRLLTALFFPTSGVLRGVDIIRRRAVFGRTPIESALRAGALCVVTRRRKGDRIFMNAVLLPCEHAFSLSGRRVHGVCCLPKGYELAILGSGAVITGIGGMDMPLRLHDDLPWWRRFWANILHPNPDPNRGTIISNEISSSHSFAKALFAILQTLFASATLYRTRGDQLQLYGYAAFGLTVAPYLVMSVLNLLGTILTPDYPTVYLIESEEMTEALRLEGARFEGMIGRVREDTLEIKVDSVLMGTLNFYAGLALGSISLAIIGGISGFRPGQSTKAERVWTMTWLVFGIYVGSAVPLSVALAYSSKAFSVILVMLYCAPAIGGFVVVGQMLQKYGSCTRIY